MPKSIRFGDLATLRRDTVQPSDSAGLAYVGLEHIEPDALHIREYGSADDVTSVKSKFLPCDVLYGKLRPYFRKVAFCESEGICSTDIWVVAPREGVRPRYLYHLMSTQAFTDNAMASAKGTRMPRASWDFVSNWEVRSRTVGEQDEILSYLDPLEDLAVANRAVDQRVEALLRAHAANLEVSVGRVPLSELAQLHRDSVKPDDVLDDRVDLYSIPAFDRDRMPESTPPNELGSNKYQVRAPALLISRLNPRIERMWPVPFDAGTTALCSTEFGVLTPVSGLQMAGLFLACMGGEFWDAFRGRVTGTSGSHQRVKPDDLMSVPVPDIREADLSTIEEAAVLIDLVVEKRRSSRAVRQIREMLLGGLADGRSPSEVLSAGVAR